MSNRKTVSDRFQSIDTNLLLDRIHNVVGHGNVTSFRTTGEWSQIVLDDRITFADGTSGAPTIFLRNRNDGATALRIHSGVFRMVCTNGLILGQGYAQRVMHIAGPKLEEFLRTFDTAVEWGIERCYEAEAESQRLIEKQVSEYQALSIIGSLPLPNRVKETAMQRVLLPLRELDATTNVWSLYNSVNEANRQLSRSGVAAMERETTLLTDIEALYEHSALGRVA